MTDDDIITLLLLGKSGRLPRGRYGRTSEPCERLCRLGLALRSGNHYRITTAGIGMRESLLHAAGHLERGAA